MNIKNKILLMGAVLSVSSYAGSIDYLSQQDAEYLGNPAMVGKIGVSGAFYNPAGLTWLEDGLYIQLNNQSLLKDYSMEKNGKKFKSDLSSPVVPSMQLVKKKGKNAFFFHSGAIAGGGSVFYNNGIATFEGIGESIGAMTGGAVSLKFLDSAGIKGQSFYIAIQAGVARQFTENWSFAAGVRLTAAERKFRGTATFDGKAMGVLPLFKNNRGVFDIDSERQALGVTGILGLNYHHPSDRFNLGIRYETKTVLDFDNKEKRLKNGFLNSSNTIPGLGNVGELFYDVLGKDGAIKQWMAEGSGKRNLPTVIAIGASFKATDRLILSTSLNSYLIEAEDDAWGNFDNFDYGYEIAFGLDYILTDKITLMAGYQYTDTGANSNTHTDTDHILDADMIAVGIKYKATEKLELIGTYSHVMYRSDTSSKYKTTYNKTVDAFGIGMKYKF